MEQEPIADLAPGERLLWQGRPDPARHFTMADAFLVPFYLAFLGIAGFIFFGMIRSGAVFPAPVLVINGLFVVIGVYAAFGRFAVKAIRKSLTRYAVTDRRAIIRTPWSTREVILRAAAFELNTTGNRRHLTVIFTNPTTSTGANVFSQAWGREQMRNTGMDVLVGGLSPAFYDVPDVDGLRRALEPTFAGDTAGLRPYGS